MRARVRSGGFTVLELVTAAAVGALLLSIAVPTYRSRVEHLKINQAMSDLTLIAGAIERYRTAHDLQLPLALTDMSGLPTKDPWGRGYEYLSFSTPIPNIKFLIRKDHNLHPLNSAFDLYSKGADGSTAAPLTAKASQDDVVWARDGSFVGLASDF
jgi:general secretion pathway protein G